ncbi:MAG: geranylgeranyl diphosphate reductase [Nitrospirae bacterium]|nr:geranylgeranyl diphosphate reductase [Nitrospirota bacterium]
MEVIVIGGGPAGSIAAKTLAEAGIRTFLIEMDLKRVKPCGGGIPSAAFEEFRIPEGIIERKVTKIGAISPSLKELTIPLKGGYLAMVRREVFDAYLRKMAEKAGAELIEGLFLNLKIGSRIEIEYKSGQGIKKLEGDFLIGADGVNSSVAHDIGVKPTKNFLALQERIKVSSGQMDFYRDRCEFWYGSKISPSLYGWVFPKGDHLYVGTAVDSKNSKGLSAYLERFKEKLGGRIEGFSLIKREASPGPVELAGTMVGRKVLLCGDAAGLILPVSAEGIYYAMKSGKMAAEEIISKFRGDPEINSGLDGYAQKWERLYGNRFRLMKRLQDIFYRDDAMREKLVEIHGVKAIQKASMALWLKKDLSPLTLLAYKLLFKMYVRL